MDRKLLMASWGFVLACGLAPAVAQEGALSAMYGKGVHLYFSGRVFQANDSFSAAIEGGSVDPRVFFFRGLNMLRMNRWSEAMGDFTHGATLEAAAPGPPFDVGRALTRIQGGPRLVIERVRQKARLDAAVAEQARQRQRYDELRATEPSILLSPPVLAPPPAAEAPGVTTPPPAQNDPFAEPPANPSPATPPPVENPPGLTPPVEAPEQPAPAAPPVEAPAETPMPAAPAGREDPFAEPPKPGEE